MKKIMMLLAPVLLLLLAYLIFEFVRVKGLISRSGQLVEQSKPYQQSPAKSRYRVLVIGDSTGVGTGVSSPNKSLAGLLGSEFPDAEIINVSKNGLRSDQLAGSLKDLPTGRFNLTVIHIGGNDLIRFKGVGDTANNIKTVLDEVSKKSDKVAVFTVGDLGQARFFPLILRPYYTRTSLQLRNELKKLAPTFKNVFYVDLFSLPNDLHAVNGYATDKLHLTDSGYVLWYSALKATVGTLL